MSQVNGVHSMSTEEIREDNARQLNDECRRLRKLNADLGESIIEKERIIVQAFDALICGHKDKAEAILRDAINAMSAKVRLGPTVTAEQAVTVLQKLDEGNS